MAFSFAELPEQQKVAFYGTLFAMAAADGTTSREELELIYESIETRELSEAGVQQLRSWIDLAPELDPLLETLASGPKELRFGVVMHLTDVALADERMKLGEKKALRRAREVLGVTREQGLAIEEFVWEVRELRAKELSEEELSKAVASATNDLWAAGVPREAIGFSGSFVGLGATGALAGLAAVGLGLGLVPGLGIAVAVGAATFLALNAVFGGRRGRTDLAAERRGRAERLKHNLERLGEVLE